MTILKRRNRNRKQGRHATGRAAVSAGLAEPQGLHAAPAATDYDRPGRDGAERELLMPAAAGSARPPWETGTVPAAPRGTGPEEPDLSELTLTDKPLHVLRPETAPERAPAGPGSAGAPQDRQRPYVPQDGGLPSARLRAIPQSGPGSRVLETLTGLPFFAGIRHDLPGGPAAGVCLGAADDIWLILDAQSAGVLDGLEAVIREAREALVYGGLAAPAVPADPDAAEHREVLERELDDCMEQARGVLHAAGNLGFISGALRQGNGESVMDVFVARAALANSTEGGDGAAALKAAGKLVDIISELCGDETACAVANGIVPSGEAAARAGEAPEPEAADEPGEVADEAATDAGEGAAA